MKHFKAFDGKPCSGICTLQGVASEIPWQDWVPSPSRRVDDLKCEAEARVPTTLPVVGAPSVQLQHCQLGEANVAHDPDHKRPLLDQRAKRQLPKRTAPGSRWRTKGRAGLACVRDATGAQAGAPNPILHAGALVAAPALHAPAAAGQAVAPGQVPS